MTKRIGLIAGKGKLPVFWTESAAKKGLDVFVYRLIESADQSFQTASQIRNVNIGQFDHLIKTLKKDGIEELVMLGKVEKSLLFQNLSMDRRIKGLFAQLENLNDDTIMLALVDEFINEGIEIGNQLDYLQDLLPSPGILTSCKPDEKILADIKYGFRMAKNIGKLDIGQTVIVKNKAVMAVEAIEGTDQAILRGGQLGGSGVVAAKVSKPQQDIRFDIPTVGNTTLENLIRVRAGALVIEANRTFLIDREDFLSKAEENNIVVMALAISDIN
ncbi:MAG: LpxI family protein [Halanaerobiaceae bacterium]